MHFRFLCLVVFLAISQVCVGNEVYDIFKYFKGLLSKDVESSPFLKGLYKAVSRDGDLSTHRFEPDFYKTVPQLITTKGYPLENHWVTTEDGFILNVQRIPHGVENKDNGGKPRPVVFLQHGLVENSFSFVANLANESLAFVLADSGADVWLGNMRGNVYSMNHTKLNVNDSTFWNWSFDEMALYDLPAMLEYVVNQTGGGQVFYVGHSQGAGTAVIQWSRDPERARKLVKYHFAMAPATRIKYEEGMAEISKIKDPLYFLLYMIYKGPTTRNVPKLPAIICHLIGEAVCRDALFELIGNNEPSFNTSRLPVYLANFPQPTSLNTVLHWFQLSDSGKFQNFDEGSPEDNMKRYGQETPPQYDLSKYDMPTTIYSGGNDIMVMPGDIEWLKESIRAEDVVNVPQFEHQDFVWGIDAATHVYSHIVKKIFSMV